MTNEIYELSATDIVTQIKSKKVSVKEVASSFIERIQAVEPIINALEQFDPEKIIADANAADKEVDKGANLGKLHGLPMTLKDTFRVKGFKSSFGCPALLEKTPSLLDSTVSARLRHEGAIFLGMSNVPELLCSYETDNLIYGRTNNPYDINRTPGGSSGGEAAILAAGGSPVGIGSDGGGSIRIPAHYTGICGLKPTQWFVPLTGGIPFDGAAGMITQLLVLGPMARHAKDLDLIMNVITGPDGLDPHTPPITYGDIHQINFRDLKIAYYFKNKNTQPTKEVIRAVEMAVEALRPEVKTIQEDFPKPVDDVFRLHWETFCHGGDHRPDIKQIFSNQTEMSLLLQKYISYVDQTKFSLTDLKNRLIEVEKFRYDMMNYMNQYDLVISPVTATPARLHGETHDHIQDYNYAWTNNLTGFPAVVVPITKTVEGLPIGIEIAAKPWQDHLCIAAAMKLQDIFGVFPIPEIRKI